MKKSISPFNEVLCLAGWEPLAIPVSHARMCTHRLEMDSYQKGAIAHVKYYKL